MGSVARSAGISGLTEKNTFNRDEEVSGKERNGVAQKYLNI